MKRRDIIIVIVVLAAFGLIWYFQDRSSISLPTSVNTQSGGVVQVQSLLKPESDKGFSAAPDLTDVQGFINSKPFKLQDYIGKKVILIDFWTYSCINCQRTTPYLNSWWEKYNDKGLLIVGVETPEFEFEKHLENVQAGVDKLGIKYPVVQDNNYGTWNAYGNRYWPRKYLINLDGYVVYDHIGEGGYQETEQKIQEVLNERMAALGTTGSLTESLTSEQNDHLGDIQSPETYFGSGRNEYFGNGTGAQNGTQNLTRPKNIQLNQFYLNGNWEFSPEYAENKSENASIIYKYNSKNVYFVAGSDNGAKIKVLQDGQPVSGAAGDDVAKDGTGGGFIKENRLYKLISNPSAGEHTLEIIIEEPGLKAFTFTFG